MNGPGEQDREERRVTGPPAEHRRRDGDPDPDGVTWVVLDPWEPPDPSSRRPGPPPGPGPFPPPPAYGEARAYSPYQAYREDPAHPQDPPYQAYQAYQSSAPPPGPGYGPPPPPPGAGGPILERTYGDLEPDEPRGPRRTGLLLALMGTAAVLVAVLLVVTLVVQGIPGRDDPAASRGPGAAAPTPTATRAPGSRAGSTQSSVQAPAPKLTWPLPRSCYRSVSRGRAVTASDRRQLGGEGLVVAAYGVQEGQLGDLRSGKAQACHTLTWRLVRHLYPPAALSLVSRFIVFEPPPRGSRSTSGRTTGRTIGFVSTRDASLRRWTLAVSIQDLDDDLFAHTLVHELGHLLSLGPRQLTAGGNGGTCRTWATGEGCARPGSLLDGYVGRTWSPSLLREWRAALRIRRDSARERALDAFYERHRSRFVGPYAATDPDEDFAESFAFWCLGRTPTSPPFVSRALRAKATFMAGRSELRGMRERCRSLR